jgi:nucleoside-diphosphate-sugar epimerase
MSSSLSRKKHLITGATGLVGRHLVEALISEGGAGCVVAMVHVRRRDDEQRVFDRWHAVGVELIECDLLDLTAVGLRPPQFDVLYHLAAHTETTSPDSCFRVNTDGTRDLLSWLGGALRGKQVVYTSTLACVDNPRFGHGVDETTTCHPRLAYGRSKLAGELVIRERQPELGFDYTILRLCTVVGSGYRPTGMFGLLPPLLARGARAGRLNWPGRVSLLDVADLVRILEAIRDHPTVRNQTYVVGGGENLRFDEVLEQMASILGCRRRRVRLPDWVWRMAGGMVWWITGLPGLPHAQRTLFWRISHMIYDGLCADSSRLDAVLGIRLRSVRESLASIYGVSPTPATSAVNGLGRPSPVSRQIEA